MIPLILRYTGGGYLRVILPCGEEISEAGLEKENAGEDSSIFIDFVS